MAKQTNKQVISRGLLSNQYWDILGPLPILPLLCHVEDAGGREGGHHPTRSPAAPLPLCWELMTAQEFKVLLAEDGSRDTLQGQEWGRGAEIWGRVDFDIQGESEGHILLKPTFENEPILSQRLLPLPRTMAGCHRRPAVATASHHLQRVRNGIFLSNPPILKVSG